MVHKSQQHIAVLTVYNTSYYNTFLLLNNLMNESWQKETIWKGKFGCHGIVRTIRALWGFQSGAQLDTSKKL